MAEKTPAHVVQGTEEQAKSTSQRILSGLGKVLKRRSKSPPAAAPPEQPHEAQTAVAAQEVATDAGAPSLPPAGVKDEWSSEFLETSLPSYAIRHAPFVWLDHEEEFWPGNAVAHIERCEFQTQDGVKLDVGEARGADIMAIPRCRDDWNTWLVLKEDPRRRPANQIAALTSHEGKPGTDHRSTSTVYLITVDKSKDLGGGFVDVFYFFFYPYNQGAAVVGMHMGNHIGDWEHAMVRFRYGTPVYLHMSAHSDGHSFKFDVLEKHDDRPVIYSARGSHANYPTTGSQRYSGIPGGPVDHTSKGSLWDPTLNYISVNHKYQDGSWSAHTPWQTPPTAACSPFPTGTQATNMLSFQGRWGNSFFEYRTQKRRSAEATSSVVGKLDAGISWFKDKVNEKEAEKARAEAQQDDDVGVVDGQINQFMKLKWGEGPTGPRDKSLNRATMNRNNDTIMDHF